MPESKVSLIRCWRWVKDQIIQDVPEDIGLCEFDCSKGQCTLEEWESCEKRQCKAAGELMPAEGEFPLETRINENPSIEKTKNDSCGT